MIKSDFRQLHFLNGNIGNIRHRKASKNFTLLCLKIIKCFFFFFPHTTIILFQVAKKIEKRNGKWYFIFILRLIASRFISKTKAENQENGDLQDIL